MIALSVNLNKIALIRNSREGNYPNVVAHAQTCIDAGAHGITVHPRPDLRHIRPDDVTNLHHLLEQHPTVEFNIEGNPFAAANERYPGFIALVERHPPQQCTLVPDTESQLTSDHGFDLNESGAQLEPLIKKLRDIGTRVSLFMDPDPQQIRLAASTGADRIELYTGPFAEAYADNPNIDTTKRLFEQHCAAARCATEEGLGINAGHDLNLDNLTLYRQLPGLQEVSIGHALTVDAIAMGLGNAVKYYLDVLDNN